MKRWESCDNLSIRTEEFIWIPRKLDNQWVWLIKIRVVVRRSDITQPFTHYSTTKQKVIQNFFFKIRNNGFNSFDYVTPQIGRIFLFKKKDNTYWNANYVKDRELKEDFNKMWI